MNDRLTRFEWLEQPGPGVRFKFRKDGTGFYEREGQPGSRLVRDNLLYRVEGERLHLKFAHARFWTEVAFRLEDGATTDGRIGARVLHLEHDPYQLAIEDTRTGPLVLSSDSGAALLG